MRPPIEEEIEAAEVEVADDSRQTAAMLVSTRLAGNAVIRVVNRCNEAQESNDLGERARRRLRIIVITRPDELTTIFSTRADRFFFP